MSLTNITRAITFVSGIVLSVIFHDLLWFVAAMLYLILFKLDDIDRRVL